ncbi:phosphodiester glycosidase family protein [Evansella clarkii]|uniref:phosphodiester glycosidase family protein n=1 Tax=Evansella clarkii TaxID=79879 RepID=UPI001116ED40|nr:phosphodiester glycosidase family protein [Evansella clarkii]
MSYQFISRSVGPTVTYWILRTPISNIRSLIINRPISSTSNTGVNGGFFAAANGYNSPPTGGRSISYTRGYSTNYLYNGTASNPVSRRTAVIYNNRRSITRMNAARLSEITNRFGTVDVAIGGTDFSSSSWSSTAYYGATKRTALAWEGSNAYLIVVRTGVVNIPALRSAIDSDLGLGLSSSNAVVLDGSGSTSMQVYGNSSRTWHNANRHIFNMVTLVNT